MREYQNYRKTKRFLFSKTAVFLLLCGTIILSLAVGKMAIKVARAISKSKETAEEVAELTKKKRELEEQIAGLKTNSGVEEEIRRKFNAAMPGEEVVVIIENGGDNKSVSRNAEEAEGASFWTRFSAQIRKVIEVFKKTGTEE